MLSCGNGFSVLVPVCVNTQVKSIGALLLEDIHDLYCKKFLVKQVHVNGKVETIVRGTSKLNTLEMHNFMESVKIDAATEFGITLPLPEDQHYLDFIHEYQNRY
mgnify:CR=1 FL=1